MKINIHQFKRTFVAAAGCCALSLIAAAPAHAALVSQLGILDLTANGGINPATGEAWKAGDKYHLIYVTTATTAATSTDIADYNAFVTADAASQTGAFANMGDVTWTALGSTLSVNAIDNSPITGPVMAVFNSAAVATGSADLWNFTWSDTNHIGRIDGTNSNVWTGSHTGGVADANDELGATNGSTRRHWTGWTSWGPADANQANVDLLPMVGISEELMVIPEPSTAILLGFGSLALLRRRR